MMKTITEFRKEATSKGFTNSPFIEKLLTALDEAQDVIHAHPQVLRQNKIFKVVSAISLALALGASVAATHYYSKTRETEAALDLVRVDLAKLQKLQSDIKNNFAEGVLQTSDNFSKRIAETVATSEGYRIEIERLRAENQTLRSLIAQNKKETEKP